MKNLVLPTLIAAVASLAAGCIFADDGSSGLGSIQVSWALKSTDAGGNPIASGCPAGSDTAVLFALPTGAPVASAFQDAFNCTDGAGVIGDLEPGDYTVWVQLTDHPVAVKYAESGSQQIHVNADGTQAAPFEIYVDRAFFVAGWTLTGRGTSCAAVANGGVSILASTAGGAGFETLVDCTEGEGRKTVSEPVPSALGGAARYTVAVSLLNMANPPLSIGDAPLQSNKTLDWGNEYEDLGVLAIAVR